MFPSPTLLFQNHAHWFLKPQAFILAGYKNSQFSLSGFQGQTLWGFIFPQQAPWCDSLFLSLLCTSGSLPIANSQHSVIHLSPIYISALPILFDMDFSPTVSCGVCSTRFGVIFWVMYADVYVEQGKLRVLLFCHLPSLSQMWTVFEVRWKVHFSFLLYLSFTHIFRNIFKIVFWVYFKIKCMHHINSPMNTYTPQKHREVFLNNPISLSHLKLIMCLNII